MYVFNVTQVNGNNLTFDEPNENRHNKTMGHCVPSSAFMFLFLDLMFRMDDSGDTVSVATSVLCSQFREIFDDSDDHYGYYDTQLAIIH